jgi:hypothetical protein
MNDSVSEKDSSVTPILKNARYFITNHARTMIRRWQKDWEQSRKHWVKRCKHAHISPEPTHDHLMWDELRLLQQEQKVLDALDDALNGASLHHLHQNHNPVWEYSWTGRYESRDADPLFSRSGCTMRYR